MTNLALWIGALSLLALLLALPAGWLLRRRGALALVAALTLAILATTSAVLAWQLAMRPTAPAPIALTAPPGQFQTIAPETLEQILLAHRGQPVLLEFYADWCSSCQVWKNQVFNRADVQAAMTPLLLLRIDASNMTPAAQDALNRFDLSGLPAIISFDQQGRELKSLRLLGQMPAPEFINWVQTKLIPASRM